MKKILAVAVATAISAPAMADLTIGANTEYNIANAGGTTSQSLETNITAAGTATAENGLFAKAFIELEVMDGGDANGTTGNPASSTDAGSPIDVDDNYLTLGNASAAVTVGYFGTKGAFNVGVDSFAPKATVAGYDADSLDDAGDQEFAIDVTAIEGVTLQLSGNYSSGTAKDYRAYISTEVSGITLAANMEEDKGAEATSGYAVSAGMDLGGVAVTASYATNTASDNTSSTAFTADLGALDLAVRYNDKADENETIYYANYNLGGMGVAGLDINVGAGAGTQSATDSKVGVEVKYAF